MKLGFGLRRIATEIFGLMRLSSSRLIYLIWLLFDFGKFKIIDNKKIKSILVVYAGATGDRYNSLGILNRLLKKFAYLKLYFLTAKKERESVKNPKIQIVDLEETKKLIDNNKIDAAVIFADTYNPELFDWEFYKKFTKIPYRVGFAISGVASFFKVIPFSFTRRVYPNEKTAMRNHIILFEKLGFYFDREIEFYFTEEAEKNAKEFIKKNKIEEGEKVIFMHPTSKKSIDFLKKGKQTSKDWPYERWAELANNLIKKYNARIIFTGAPEENEIIEKIIPKINNSKKVINAAGKLSIEEIGSLLKRADLLICLDTAIGHIGGQVGVPVIVLLGGNPLNCYPWTAKKMMLFHPEVCTNCRRSACPEGNNICMKTITVSEVFDAATKFLK